LGATGKAIVFIAKALMCGAVFWFLSNIMFRALRGLPLAIIRLFIMTGALLIIPNFKALLKAKPVVRKGSSITGLTTQGKSGNTIIVFILWPNLFEVSLVYQPLLKPRHKRNPG